VRNKIFWAQPKYWGDESYYLQKALDSTWISGGPYVEELETRIASLCQMPHALAVCNGTAAIHLAYLGIDLKPGDEVIIPNFGFQAAANVACHMGARPIFAEVDSETWCLTAASIECHLTPKTKAIVAIHSYGNMCPMDEICDLANRHGLAVIEDAAEALGSSYRGNPAGSFGTVNSFSFQATKTITTGEGGMVTTRDKEIASRMALFRSHGMSHRRYWHEVHGHNFRLTNLQAALGCAQLNHFEEIVSHRAHLHQCFRRHLSHQPGITLQRFAREVNPVVWALGCRLDPSRFPHGRDDVMSILLRDGIETRPGFYAASFQPLYNTARRSRLPVSEAVSREILCLPFHLGLTETDIEFICDALIGQRATQRASA
jgi:perosamine synthetase